MEFLINLYNKLTALSGRVGTKSFVITVRGNALFNAQPLIYSTDAETARFFPMVLKIDPMELAVKFEGFAIAGGKVIGMYKSPLV